jgi:hypothetical protein
MMPTSRKSIMVMAAALLLGWSMPGPTPAAEGDEPAPGERTAPAAAKAPAADPAAHKAAAPAPTPVPPETPTAPPRHLRLVGDHWTPYSPPDPESFPSGSTVHIIVHGETLWGLADLSYNNPYLWPQLWSENRYITDSHWIYPGDPLLVPPRPVVVTQAGPEAAGIVPQGLEGAPHTELAPLEGPEQEAPEAPLTAESPSPAPKKPAPLLDNSSGYSSGRLVERNDLRCSGYITEDSHRGKLFIAENEEPIYHNITEGSLVYLNRGSKKGEGLKAGDVFTIVEKEGKVLHPVTGRSEGLYYKRLGELRVLKVLDETSLASVTFACDDIRVGDELVAATYEPVPEGPVPPFDRLAVERNGKPTGFVIHAKDTAVRVVADNIVQIDLGREDGIAPGAFLTAFSAVHKDRRGHMPDYHYQYNSEVYSNIDLHWDEVADEYPSLPIGQMIVISAEPHTATVKILHSVREITVGMLVQVD